MYSKHLVFSPNEYLELNSRITSEGDRLMLSLRGNKNSKEITISSVYLSEAEVKQLIDNLQGWLESENKSG